ncbi:cytochrome P450 [Streptomyces sp. ET3-23]|uniref:cytochrome P450 n=1 Tax=Streptomyces sp. ET3-23 TaxID=2885643 RepID=UPI001D127E88|nr:cytochrome P450 [Streptomyces sp. ET3-23]MCC2280709.1 cytochrome P450 [Streptomyces sp. ET3-23]
MRSTVRAATASAAAGQARAAKAPRALPLLGHAVSLQRDPLSLLLELARHGDLVEVRLGPKRAHLVCHPDLVREVLTDTRRFDKGGWLYDKLSLLVGNGLVTSARDEHRRQRRLMQPAFHPARIDQYGRRMAQEADTAAAARRPGTPIDIADAMHRITTQITTRTLFATEISSEALTALKEALPVYLRGVYQRTMSPISLPDLPLPGNVRFVQACRQLHHIIDSVIAAHHAAPPGTDSLLAALLACRDPDSGDALTEQEIHEQAMAMLLASTEEVAAALTWTFHLLSAHPPQKEQVDQILAGRPLTLEDLPRLEVTRRVVTEALRIRPPVWLFARVTTCDTRLAHVDLPVGTTLLISPYVLYHDPQLFPEPEQFAPDRWLPTSPLHTAQAAQRCAMLPFGAGNRKCIGDTYAMTWALLVLAAITTRWHLQPHGKPSLRAPQGHPRGRATDHDAAARHPEGLGWSPHPPRPRHRGACPWWATPCPCCGNPWLSWIACTGTGPWSRCTSNLCPFTSSPTRTPTARAASSTRSSPSSATACSPRTGRWSRSSGTAR